MTTFRQHAYPLNQTEHPAAAAATAENLHVLPRMSFAQEVRAERLGMLWKATLFAAFVIGWILVVAGDARALPDQALLLPTLVASAGSILAGLLLRGGRFGLAVWSYALGDLLAVALAIAYGESFGRSYAPYLLPLLVFVVGLLLPVRATLALVLVTAGAALGVPSLVEGALVASQATLFALGLTLVAAVLAAQMSGQLYAIAEWALETYHKERQTTFALSQIREALERSLMRQRALTLQVQQANQELEFSRKAEEEAKNFRGQFLANMSHELRTPLNAIIGFSQTMLDFPAMYDGVELPVEYRQDMNQILSSGKHLLNIINDILDLSKIDAGKLDLEIQPVELGPIIKGVLATAVGLVGDKSGHVRLLRSVPDPLPMVLADPLRVRQVLLNLYSNAAKFTDVGYIRLLITVDGDEVIFGVEDTGIGIAEADRASIFEEFRQGTAGRKKGRQGAGLGLAISQQLVRLMNGRLWFDSAVGRGSTFYFSLPRYSAPPSDGRSAADEAPVAATEPAAAIAGMHE